MTVSTYNRQLVLLLAIAFCLSAQTKRIVITAEKKLALVIGNSAYPRKQFPAAAHDADQIAATLRSLGFEVIQRANLNREQMQNAVGDFSKRVEAGDLALVYFAGCGLQFGRENFLLPVDYSGAPTGASSQGYSVSQLRDNLEKSRARLRVLILDANRTYPYSGVRSSPVGFGPAIDVAVGTVVFSAASPNQTPDETTGSGLFARELSQALQTPGLGLRRIFEDVKDRVSAATKGKQVPAIYDNVVGELYLNGAPTASPSVSVDRKVETAFWQSVKDSKDRSLLNAYLQRYPSGQFSGEARSKLKALSEPSTQTARVVSPLPDLMRPVKPKPDAFAAFRVSIYFRRDWCEGVLNIGDGWITFDPQPYASTCAGLESIRASREEIGSFGKNKWIGAVNRGFHIELTKPRPVSSPPPQLRKKRWGTAETVGAAKGTTMKSLNFTTFEEWSEILFALTKALTQ